MNRFVISLLALGAFGLAACAPQQPSPGTEPPSAVISKTDDAVMTSNDIAQLASGLSKANLHAIVNDQDALKGWILDVHMERSLLARARAVGLDDDPSIQQKIRHSAEQILINSYLGDIQQSADVTGNLEELANEYYLSNPGQFSKLSKRKLAHILFSVHKEQCDENALPPKQQAAKVFADLQAGKLSFEEAARKYSDDSISGPEGGELAGYFTLKDRQDPIFLQAAFRIENPGSYTKPVETEFGFHIIKLIEEQPASMIPYEEVRDQIVEQLEARARTAEVDLERASAYPRDEQVDFAAARQVLINFIEKHENTAN